MANADTTLSQEDIDELLKSTQSQEPELKDRVLGMGNDPSSGNLPKTDSKQDAENLSSFSDAKASVLENQTLEQMDLQSLVAEETPLVANRESNTELLKDISLRFTVVLGSTKMLIKDVVKLGEGSIVELEKYENEEVELLVNDRLFGRGRLKVVGDYFGVQITEILNILESYGIKP